MNISRKLPIVARIGLGLLFAVMGLNKVLSFLPQPPMSGPPAEFFGALAGTGYMLPLLALTEVAAGIMLIANRYAALGVTLLAPVVVNIVAFHLLLARGGLPMALTVLALEVYVAWSYRHAFAPMLRARSLPGSAPASSTSQEKLTLAEAR